MIPVGDPVRTARAVAKVILAGALLAATAFVGYRLDQMRTELTQLRAYKAGVEGRDRVAATAATAATAAQTERAHDDRQQDQSVAAHTQATQEAARADTQTADFLLILIPQRLRDADAAARARGLDPAGDPARPDPR